MRLLAVKYLDHFQFERVGFFVCDKDTDVDAGKFVFNLTVGLKEDATAKKARGGAGAAAAAAGGKA